MAPGENGKLLSRDPKQRAEQARTEILATAKRLIAEAIELREAAARIVGESDALIAKLKRDHPEK